MKFRRRTPRRGRHLAAVAIDSLFAADPEFAERNAELARLGFVAQPTVRPYRRSDGGFTIRVVWRRRTTEDSVVMETTISETAHYPAVEVRG